VFEVGRGRFMVLVGDIGVILGGRSSTLKVELPKYYTYQMGSGCKSTTLARRHHSSRQEEMTATEFNGNGRPTYGASIVRVQVVTGR
jgi:hypothetical protein